jgi:uncharacterized OB-fold protein
VSAPTDLETAVRAAGGDPADLPFWQGCREGRFLLHRCELCGRCYWPASRCIDHGDAAMRWVDSSGSGTLHTYTVMHHAFTSEMKGKVPYVVGVIKLVEGPFFHSNVVDCPPDKLSIDMQLQAEMIPHECGLALPVFRRNFALQERDNE